MGCEIEEEAPKFHPTPPADLERTKKSPAYVEDAEHSNVPLLDPVDQGTKTDLFCILSDRRFNPGFSYETLAFSNNFLNVKLFC